MTTTIKRPVSKIIFPHKDLLGVDRLDAETISSVLDLAEYYVVQNRRKSQTTALLKGMIIINLFLENSTRTRLSFEIAGKRLGADVVNMAAEGSSLHKGETVEDTIKTINALLPDLIVIRHRENGAVQKAASLADCPVINAGDGTGEHPTQALLDALTLRRHFKKIEGLTVAICGDILHSRVAHSNAYLLQKMGATVKFIGPEALLPKGLSHATTDMEEGLKGADAVMMLRLQKERIDKTLKITEAEYSKDYGLTIEKLSLAKREAVVMHPGPINRGVEIAAEIADDPKRSLITTQVEMGVAVRMACLDLLTRGRR
jgi:aspartate carbamoyltransferase catalytic subunit